MAETKQQAAIEVSTPQNLLHGVEFLKNYEGYKAGERAGFPKLIADELYKAEIGTPYQVDHEAAKSSYRAPVMQAISTQPRQ